VFEQAGGLAIRPEELPLERQMEIYSGARKLVFCEGSALHGLQLLGRLPAEVIVLKRRRDPFCTEALTPRVQALHHIDIGDNKLMLELNRIQTQFNKGRGAIVLDSEKFLATMNELGIPISKYWNEKEYYRAAEKHILERIDEFVEVWSKLKNRAARSPIREEFISLVRASKFAYMAPMLDERFSNSE